MTCLAVRLLHDSATVVSDTSTVGLIDGKPDSGELTKCWSIPHLNAIVALRGQHNLLLSILVMLATFPGNFDSATTLFRAVLLDEAFRKLKVPVLGAHKAAAAEVIFLGFSAQARRVAGYVYKGPNYLQSEIPCPGCVFAPSEDLGAASTKITTSELVGIVRRQAQRVRDGEIRVDPDYADACGGRLLVTELTRDFITQHMEE